VLYGQFSLIFLYSFSEHLFKVTFIAKFFLWKSSCIENFLQVKFVIVRIPPLGNEFYSSSKIFKNTKKKSLKRKSKKSKKLLVERYDEDSTRLLVTRLVN
jgi:hypothetical protein